jgi:hypothetical protein
VIELKIDQDSPIFFNIAGGRRRLALFHTTIARKKENRLLSKPTAPVKKTEPLIDEDLSRIIPSASPPPRWLDWRRRRRATGAAAEPRGALSPDASFSGRGAQIDEELRPLAAMAGREEQLTTEDPDRKKANGFI